ncbi:MAG: PDZ domain-containing protein [Chloroflexi bacterium]|nr:PDZ domain-containing protein [Chloroflexota bacterium]MBU1750597.1 PDZ domain-containing protein [Chloroflexota bacterium]MBU1878052.1 PDZ domain-containing protein [Chloroflexota bacterium]
METRQVVLALVGAALALVALVVVLWGGCVFFSLACGCCGISLAQSGDSGPVYYEPPARPYRVPATPQPMEPGMGQAGALITEVVPGSPAEAAGLQPGDVIVSVDRQRLQDGQNLADIVTQYRPGDEVTLGLWRQGHTEFVRVRLGENPERPGVGYLGIYFRVLGQGPMAPRSGD